MELADRLHQLTAAELAPVVQNALRDDHAWPLTWEFDALEWTGTLPQSVYSGSPASLGQAVAGKCRGLWFSRLWRTSL
jgi:hypothetical protein